MLQRRSDSLGTRGVYDPVGQLHELLAMKGIQRSGGGVGPYRDLDKLYLSVLQHAVSKNPRKEHVECIQRVVATIVCLRNPLSVNDLAVFLSMLKDDVRNTLRYLHSVVVVPDDDESLPVRFFHQSFPTSSKTKSVARTKHSSSMCSSTKISWRHDAWTRPERPT